MEGRRSPSTSGLEETSQAAAVRRIIGDRNLATIVVTSSLPNETIRNAQCDPFGIPSMSHWTGAAITVQSSRTKTSIVTRLRASTRPMPFSLAG